jgi:polyhydroxybutyrate depolymerase
VEGWLQAWAERNACQDGPSTTPGPTAQTTIIAYADCAADAEVLLYKVEDGGHTWFGAQPRDQYPAFVVGNHISDLDASAIMWDFFSRHSLPQD